MKLRGFGAVILGSFVLAFFFIFRPRQPTWLASTGSEQERDERFEVFDRYHRTHFDD